MRVGVGLSSVLQCLPEDVAFLMHGFAALIGFGGLQINRPVANRALVLLSEKMNHATPPRD